MKKILNIQTMLLLACFFQAKAQTANIDLDINNVKARLLNCGDMFWDPQTGTAGYEFPKGSAKHANFASALWISGVDSATNTMKVAAQSFRQRGHDYWPGPITAGTAVDTIAAGKWNRFWKINLTEINAFRFLYAGLTNPLQIQATLGANSNLIPSIIKQWPAKGNQSTLDAFGNPLPINSDMAPFVDLNNNGLYEWTQGDYPAIKGHQAIWWVFNDQRTHYQSGSSALGLEIQAMAYACATNDALNNMTFYDFKIKNASSNTYLNTRFAQFIDIELGGACDDYLGFDTTRRMVIGYNSDNFDEGVNGYGNNLTQSACILLKTPTDNGLNKPLGATSFFTNGGPTPQNDPNNAIKHRNFILGTWANGATLTDACNAIDSGNSVNFIYPDDPSNTSGFSEKQCNNFPGDRRALIGSTSFTFHPNTIVEFNIAFVNTPTGSNINNFNLIKAYADTAIAHQSGCVSSVVLSIEDLQQKEQFKIHPNPSSTLLNITWESPEVQSIALYSLIGEKLNQFSTKGLTSLELDVTQYPKGIYFLRFAQKGKQHIEKIAIQ